MWIYKNVHLQDLENTKETTAKVPQSWLHEIAFQGGKLHLPSTLQTAWKQLDK